MRYRIEYAGGKCFNFANSRPELLKWLKLLEDEVITDIRKVYRNGSTDPAMEKYRKHIKKSETPAAGTAGGSKQLTNNFTPSV